MRRVPLKDMRKDKDTLQIETILTPKASLKAICVRSNLVFFQYLFPLQLKFLLSQ
jgi:hypothetical protein